MVVYALSITAKTENIKYFQPALGINNKDFVYVFQVCLSLFILFSLLAFISAATFMIINSSFLQVSYVSCVNDVPRQFSINLQSRKSNYKVIKLSFFLFFSDLLVCLLEFLFFSSSKQCRICHTRGCYIKMIPGYDRAFKQEDGDNLIPVTLMHFECYGVIPLEFSFNGRQELFTKEHIMKEIDFQNGSVVTHYHDSARRAATIVNWESTFDQI